MDAASASTISQRVNMMVNKTVMAQEAISAPEKVAVQLQRNVAVWQAIAEKLGLSAPVLFDYCAWQFGSCSKLR